MKLLSSPLSVLLLAAVLLAGCGSAQIAGEAVRKGQEVRNGLTTDYARALDVAVKVARIQTTDLHFAGAESALRAAAFDSPESFPAGADKAEGARLVPLAEVLRVLANLKAAELKSASLREKMLTQREVLIRRGERLNAIDMIVLQQIVGSQSMVEKILEGAAAAAGEAIAGTGEEAEPDPLPDLTPPASPAPSEPPPGIPDTETPLDKASQ